MIDRTTSHVSRLTSAPTVSVIIPTYNRAQMAVEAVESVLAQTYRPIEVIVVDDGSTDDTAQRLAAFGDRIRYMRQPNRGVGAARNHGLRLATGAYLAFLDSDDLWLPEKLERQVAVLEREPRLGFVYGVMQVVDESGRIVGQKPAGRFPPGNGARADTLETMLLGNYVPTSTVVMRAEVARQIGYFEETLTGPEDYHYWARAAARRPFLGLRDVVATYRLNEGSITRNVWRFYRNQAAMFALMARDPAFARHERLVRSRQAGSWYLAALEAVKLGQWRGALDDLGRSIRALPSVGTTFRRPGETWWRWPWRLVKPYAVAVYVALRAMTQVRNAECGVRSVVPRPTSHVPRRVLFVETGTGFGGSSAGLYHILKPLDRTRFEPILWAYADGDQVSRIRALGIPTIVQPSPDPGRHPRLCQVPSFGFWYRTVPMTWRLWRFCRRYRIALVHVNNGILTQIPAITAARLAGVPCVCYIQGVEPVTWIQRPFIRMVDRYAFVTEAIKPEYRLERFVPAQRLCPAIPHGVDLSVYDRTPSVEEARRSLRLDGARRVVGIVARLVPGKGHEDLLRAAAIVKQRIPDVTWLIVGDCPPSQRGGIKEELVALAQQLGLDGSVIFAGWRSDIPAVVQACDIVTLPSHSEGLGRALLEAMALGKPAVATRVGGLPEVVVDGQTGLLVPPRSPEALAAAFVRLLEAPEEAQRMGREGRCRIEEIYEMGWLARRWEALYDELLQGVRTGREKRA